MATYDGNFTLTLSTFSSSNVSTFLGNGKVGLITSANPLCLIESTLITASSTTHQTKYSQNTIKSFNTFEVSFEGALSNNAPLSAPIQQSLDMQCAIFNTSYLTGSNVPVSCDIYAPRGLPFCTVQTFRFDATTGNLPFRHGISCDANISHPEYNNNVVFDNVGNQPVYVMTGHGSLGHCHGHARAAFATSYVFENVDSTNLGFNVFADEPNKAFNFFTLSNISQTSRVHVITAHMTSFDFDTPVEEAKRVVINVINRTMTLVRSDHVKQWLALWTSDVNVLPKQAISLPEINDILQVRRNLRLSLYHIYSSVRDHVNLDVNAATFGFIDMSGTVLYSGDLSIIPLLLLLKPEFARGILDYRYKTLTVAQQLAAGYGYAGAKYPYENDRLGYKNALYWNTTSSLTLYNTALVSINMWNYFRVTKDTEWLMRHGFPVMKDIATFFASIIQDDSEELGENPPGPGGYPPLTCCCDGIVPADESITNVVSLSGILSAKNNALTNVLVRLALRYAIEASYELSLPVPELWIDLYQGLPIPIATPDIIKFDEDNTVFPTIAEPLFTFTPNLSTEMEKKHENIAYIGIPYQTMLRHNYDTYMPHADPSNPFNQYLSGLLTGKYAQSDPTYVTSFYTHISDFATSNAKDAWGGFGDITISALYVMMVMQGMTNLSIVGGVAPTRFYYHELGLESSTSANMPPTWMAVRVGMGRTRAPLITYNVQYYT